MNGLLDGQRALITGAGSGIGEAIGHAMAKAGARIVAVDIDGAAAARAAQAIAAAAASFACDVADRQRCDDLAVAVHRQIGAISMPGSSAAEL